MSRLHFPRRQCSFHFNTGNEGAPPAPGGTTHQRYLWVPGLLLAILVGGPAAALSLRVVTTGAPAINCVFDPSCRVVVTDTTADIVLAGGGTGFLQSRTFKGQPGAPAELFTGYEYRIDLSNAVAVTAATCITSLIVDFGPIVTGPDYNGDGAGGEHVFMVTSGGLGNVGLSSASEDGGVITFTFAAPVCAGKSPGAGDSTYFFGLASKRPPRDIKASYTAGGTTSSIATRAPSEPI